MYSSKYNMPHSIYLIRAVDASYQKIGVARNVLRRLSDFNVPFELTIQATIELPEFGAATLIEHALHKHYQDQNIHREWFSGIDPEDFQRTARRLIRENRHRWF
jgi:hypothetical protein